MTSSASKPIVIQFSKFAEETTGLTQARAYDNLHAGPKNCRTPAELPNDSDFFSLNQDRGEGSPQAQLGGLQREGLVNNAQSLQTRFDFLST